MQKIQHPNHKYANMGYIINQTKPRMIRHTRLSGSCQITFTVPCIQTRTHDKI